MRKWLMLCVINLVTPVWATQTPSKPISENENVYMLMELLGSSLKLIKDDYVEDVSYKTMVEKAINGVLTSQDPHSGFLDKDEMDDIRVHSPYSRHRPCRP